MTTITRQLSNISGANVTIPTQNGFSSTSFEVFANDAAYEAVYGAGSEGDAYFNSTDQQVRIYKNAAWQYHKADESVYDNATSGLSATDVQAAIDEVEGRVDTAETNISTNTSNIWANTSDIADIRTTQGTSDGDTNLGTFTGTTISDNGSVKAGMQELETAVEGKQADVITTRGDTIVGNASNVASRLPIGSSGFVLTSDGTDAAWAPATGGSGGGTGKNYILNPDAAVNHTSDVTNTATTGSWTIARTTTAAELPEETKGTAFKISGSTLTVGDTVEFAIEATGIDDADGRTFGRAKVSVLDISGSINGEYKIQVYNVTSSVYVGDEDTITGTGTYYLDVPLVATNDYEFHLKAATASPTNIGLSGITIEPVSQTRANLPGKSYSEANGDFTITSTDWSTTYSSLRPYQDIAGDWFLLGNFAGTFSATKTAPSLTISGVTFKTTASGEHHPVAAQISDFGVNNYAATRATADNGASTMTFEANGSAMDFVGASFDVPLASKPTWADFNSSAPTASDVQYENARVRYYMTSNTAFTAGNPIPYDTEDTTTHQTFGDWTNSSGRITVPVAGTYTITARNQWTVARVAGDQDLIYVNRNGGGDTVERRLSSTSEVLALGTEVYLTPSDTFFVSSNVSKTINSLSELSYLEISKISDYSARKASLPFPNGTVRLDTGNGFGAVNTKIRLFTNKVESGDAFTTALDANDGASITANRDMVASFSYTDRTDGASLFFGISLNGTVATDITSLSASERLVCTEGTTTDYENVSCTIKINKGDIIRPHTNGTAGTPSTANAIQFVAQELYPLGN